VDSRGRNISKSGFDIAEVVVETERVAADISVLEILRKPSYRRQLRLMPGVLAGHVSLETR